MVTFIKKYVSRKLIIGVVINVQMNRVLVSANKKIRKAKKFICLLY